jgi:GalNAc5-diNAcBac-PP-undecaprenol beta-1,3-glucosyltransferase
VPEATVVIPTFDHGPTLRHSVGSVLAQTLGNLEIVIVGDGVPEDARPVIAELEAADERVRFMDRPKGEHYGQVHRHEAVMSARSDAILYLGDDDLWLPDHAEHMVEALRKVDFAAAVPFEIGPDNSLTVSPVELELEHVRAREADIPLSCVGHTVDAYKRLPRGWEPGEPKTAVHKPMWAKFLSDPQLTATGVHGAQALVLHTFYRRKWDRQRLLDELEDWAALVATAEGRLEITRRALLSTLDGWRGCELEHHNCERHARYLESRLEASK